MNFVRGNFLSVVRIIVFLAVFLSAVSINTRSEVNLEDFTKMKDEKPITKEAKDPFAAPKKKFVSGEMKLFGIVHSRGNAACLINDMILFVGDEFDGNHIVSIDQNNVIVEGPGGRIRLKL